MTIEDQILKRYSKKHFKITNSYKNKDAWRWLKKNKFFGMSPITEAKFGKLIKGVHDVLINNFLQGHNIKLPHGMGIIELRKSKASVKIKNNKAVTNRPVDWKRTIELWKNDEDAREDKILVRSEVNSLYKIVYLKHKTRYSNNRFFKFSPNRFFKIALKDKINNNEIDSCYEIYTSKNNNE